MNTTIVKKMALFAYCLQSPFNQRNPHITGQSPIGIAENEAGHEYSPIPLAHTAEFAMAEICCGDERVEFDG
jgi:hypothetical protein